MRTLIPPPSSSSPTAVVYCSCIWLLPSWLAVGPRPPHPGVHNMRATCGPFRSNHYVNKSRYRLKNCWQQRQVKFVCERIVFNTDWTSNYFFTLYNGKVLCLVCRESTAVVKESNIRGHFESKPADLVTVDDNERKIKASNLLNYAFPESKAREWSGYKSKPLHF